MFGKRAATQVLSEDVSYCMGGLFIHVTGVLVKTDTQGEGPVPTEAEARVVWLWAEA